MAFNLSNFKAGISQYKFDGLAQANKFHVMLDVPRGISAFLPAIPGPPLRILSGI